MGREFVSSPKVVSSPATTERRFLPCRFLAALISKVHVVDIATDKFLVLGFPTTLLYVQDPLQMSHLKVTASKFTSVRSYQLFRTSQLQVKGVSLSGDKVELG